MFGVLAHAFILSTQVGFCEFEDSLVYIESSRPVRAIHCDPVSKKKNLKTYPLDGSWRDGSGVCVILSFPKDLSSVSSIYITTICKSAPG